MVERQKEAHREPEKGKQKGEGKSRNKDPTKVAALLPLPPFCTNPPSSSSSLTSSISSSSSITWRKGIHSVFLAASELSYRSASRMCGTRTTTDMCTWASSGSMGRPGLHSLSMENPSPSSAQNGLEKAESHQEKEKVLADQFFSVV